MRQIENCKISKKVPWVLRYKDIKRIYPLLQNNYESSGILKFEQSNVGTPNKMVTSNVKSSEINKGGRNTVYTPMGVSVFHVHPYQCYLDEKVVWGWPSGEDIAQTITWALRGNLIHCVFSVEGIYSIEINPCFNKFMKKLTSFQRGLIITWIEVIGKSTHGLRTLRINKKSPLTPSDWIRFVNNITINKDSKKCGIISCAQVPFFNDNNIIATSLKNYINTYHDNMTVNLFSSDGDFEGSKTMKTDDFIDELVKLRNGIHEFKCGAIRTAKTKWGKNKIFHCNLIKHPKATKMFKKKDYEAYFEWLKKKEPLKCPKKSTLLYFEGMNSICNEKDVKTLFGKI